MAAATFAAENALPKGPVWRAAAGASADDGAHAAAGPAHAQPAGERSRRVARTIGVLGGTFNPPHLGHRALAQAALEELGLERMLIVPAQLSPFKTGAEDPGAEHRLRMCELAFGGHPELEVCTLELDRPGPSYTVDTLRSIRATDPDAQLVLLAGADTARSLPGWHEPRDLMCLAGVAVAGRDDIEREAVEEALRSVGAEDHPAFLRMPPVQISSSQVRARVAAGQPVQELVGSEVARYIAQHGLYRKAAA